MPDITATVAKQTAYPTQGNSAARPVADTRGQGSPVTGTTLPTRSDSKAEVPDLPELERLSEGLAEFAKSLNRDLTFRVDENSGRMVVTVIDGETKEVIRQVPGEEMLRMAAAVESASAVLFDAKA